jgi:hypothetical protein
MPHAEACAEAPNVRETSAWVAPWATSRRRCSRPAKSRLRIPCSVAVGDAARHPTAWAWWGSQEWLDALPQLIGRSRPPGCSWPAASQDQPKPLNSPWKAVAGSPGGVAPPGSHRSVRDGLPSHGSYHPVGKNWVVHRQCANSPGWCCTTLAHHALARLNLRSRLYFLRAHRTR